MSFAEPFHQWTRTVVIPVKGDQLVPALPHQSALALRLGFGGMG